MIMMSWSTRRVGWVDGDGRWQNASVGQQFKAKRCFHYFTSNTKEDVCAGLHGVLFCDRALTWGSAKKEGRPPAATRKQWRQCNSPGQGFFYRFRFSFFTIHFFSCSLWLSSYEDHHMMIIRWWSSTPSIRPSFLSCDYHHMMIIIWWSSYNDHDVMIIIWWSSYDDHHMMIMIPWTQQRVGWVDGRINFGSVARASRRGEAARPHGIESPIHPSICPSVFRIMWLSLYDDHHMKIIRWWSYDGHQMMIIIWWSSYDDHHVMIIIWWSWCDDHDVMINTESRVGGWGRPLTKRKRRTTIQSQKRFPLLYI